MKIYLAGPMRGLPDYNFPSFHAAAKSLRADGHIVFSPAERDIEKYGAETTSSNPVEWEAGASKIREALKADLVWICDEAEAIALLPGWERSRGATAELATARALGLRVFYLRERWVSNGYQLVDCAYGETA